MVVRGKYLYGERSCDISASFSGAGILKNKGGEGGGTDHFVRTPPITTPLIMIKKCEQLSHLEITLIG